VSFIMGDYYRLVLYVNYRFIQWGKLGSKQMNEPISVMTRRGMERHDSGMGK
jgi:hypothetical protein